MKNKNIACKVEDCNKESFCKGMCDKHYQQIKRNGIITSLSPIVYPIIPELLSNDSLERFNRLQIAVNLILDNSPDIQNDIEDNIGIHHAHINQYIHAK